MHPRVRKSAVVYDRDREDCKIPINYHENKHG
jgi:hypothetical protein